MDKMHWDKRLHTENAAADRSVTEYVIETQYVYNSTEFWRPFARYNLRKNNLSLKTNDRQFTHV